MTLLVMLNEIAAFWNSPGGKVFSSFCGGLLFYLGLFFKAWKKERAAAKQKESGEEEEERDWEIRCMRTQADVERIDAFAERLILKVANAGVAFTECLPLLDDPAQNAKAIAVKQAVISFILADLDVEFKAHAKERPAYLKRLNETPPLFRVAPLPPPPETKDGEE